MSREQIRIPVSEGSSLDFLVKKGESYYLGDRKVILSSFAKAEYNLELPYAEEKLAPIEVLSKAVQKIAAEIDITDYNGILSTFLVCVEVGEGILPDDYVRTVDCYKAKLIFVEYHFTEDDNPQDLQSKPL